MRMRLLSSAVFMCISSSLAFGAMYKIDRAHSSVGFKIRHLMISHVEGRFGEFKGTGEGTITKDKATIEAIHIEIDTASIDTQDKKRDDHLRGDDFFKVKTFKTISFKLNDKKGEKKADYSGNIPTKIYGKLTLLGVTKDVVLDVKWGGVMVDPWKNEKIAFEVKGTINRKDYGLKWNKPLESAGDFLIGDDVEFIARIEAIHTTETAIK